MSKNDSMYFIFEMERNGPDISYVIYPGRVSMDLFRSIVDALDQSFRNFGDNNNQCKRVERIYEDENGKEENVKTISIYQSVTPAIVRLIMSHSPSSPYKILFRGENSKGEKEEMKINNFDDACQVTRLIPMYNKNNNDMTTRRRK